LKKNKSAKIKQGRGRGQYAQLKKKEKRKDTKLDRKRGATLNTGAVANGIEVVKKGVDRGGWGRRQGSQGRTQGFNSATWSDKLGRTQSQAGKAKKKHLGIAGKRMREKSVLSSRF